MIDEEKLIERINQEPTDGMYTYEIIEAIEEQPKIGEWIPCSERLPEKKINPITQDFYEYQVTYQNGDVKDIRYYKFGKGHWWNDAKVMDKYVIAWMPLPDPYEGRVTSNE